MEYLTLLCQLVPIGLLLYFYYTRKFNYWSARGVKGPPPSLVKFGNLRDFSSKGQTAVELEWQATYGKVYGIYQLTTPILTVLDPELAKQVLVKDFHIFVNRDKNLFDHEYFNSNLFNSEDETWRRVRSITTPSFTTGKLRAMTAMMNHCVSKLDRYLDNVVTTKSGAVNVKEIITGFTVDVIASIAFGTETNDSGVFNDSNIFVKNATSLVDFSTWRAMAFFALPTRVNKWIGNSVGFDDRVFDFFINLSKEIVNQRRVTGQKRSDLVQLLMDAYVYESDLKEKSYDQLAASADHDEPQEKETKIADGSVKKTLTEREIIAQCLIFFLAGFETTATTISMATYFMAQNAAVQQRLHRELTAALDGLEVNSEAYFEAVNSRIPYLDAFVKETLRRNPPLPRLQRRVGVKEYKLAGIPLEQDTEVQIGTYAIHHNPEYYPQPHQFKPERFLPEFKHLLVPYAYLPFGQGPRNCVGMRFAYQEIKLCLAQIVRHFQFDMAPQTPDELKFESLFLLSCKEIPLKISRRC